VDETLVYADEEALAREADFRVGPYHVYRRPYVNEFIAAVSRWFDLAVWSSATASYVQGVVENVFGSPDDLRCVWARDRCTSRFDPEHRAFYYAKNLSKLRRHGFDLEHVLMVDDSPEKLARHYGNHIHVSSFTGNESDRDLRDLLPFLESLRDVENVRRIEKRWWRRYRPAEPPGT
jgi:RNA polymerase II subunit A small phosphatase-like protein